jgi:hypothetical protein
MGFLAAAGISAGARLISGLAGLFGGGGEPAEPEWGAMRSRYERELRKSLRGTVEEASDRLRLETARAGTSMAGAYLGGLTEMQKKASDILSRELTAYDLQQETQKTQWQMQKSMTQYQEGVQRRQILPQMLEGIGGDIAGYYQGKGMRERSDVIRGEMATQRSGIEDLLQNQNDLLRQVLENWGFSNRVNNAVRPYTTSPQPYISPMKSYLP